jgi:cobalamin-dependent methionine synthase I
MTPRQSTPNADGVALALCDFVAPEGFGDNAGAFAITISESLRQRLEELKADDTHRALILQGLCDRLVEAASEWLHTRVRKELWGYAPAEQLSPKQLFQGRYQGIRPAIGYPSLPDQSIIFTVDRLLGLKDIGITLTVSGAMHPHASVCGLMIAHPAARYFAVGKIDREQLCDYARRRGTSPEEIARFLTKNLE